MTKQKNKSHIMSRYGFIIFIFIVLSVAIIFKLVSITVVNAKKWNDAAAIELSRVDTVYPNRGNILADNGNILACDLQVYDIKLDMRLKCIEDKRSVRRSLDSLADSLDVYFPMDKNFAKLSAEKQREKSWHTRFDKILKYDRSVRNRGVIITKGGSLEDYEKIRNFPYLRTFEGDKRKISPLYKTDRRERIYPFGEMAMLSIGRVNTDSLNTIHGYYGLEKALDSLLYGKKGTKKKIPFTNGLAEWVVDKPVRGYDVHTTINIDMQDMLEEELLKICMQANAEWGTAMIMERETGAIKAISNVERDSLGNYGEALNRIVLAYEPGSVIKPISLMVAFEDGIVKSVNDVVETSKFMGTEDRHAPPIKTMKQVIEKSSNTGISRIIHRGYGNSPEKYHDRLAALGFLDKFNTGLDQERIPFVPPLVTYDHNGKHTDTELKMSLARQAYGYNTMVPPLYTAAFYNAIANDGVLVYPRLIESLRDENGHDSIVPRVSKRICSPETARKVRECIREVVHSDFGTGHHLQDDRIEIAGKTGTAYPIAHRAYDMSRRRFAFAGFFPYENPKYTMMVLILAPGGNNAANTSGRVMLNMALRLYSRGMLDNVSTYTTEASTSVPVIETSTGSPEMLRNLQPVIGNQATKRLQTAAPGDADKMPNLLGYDAPAAVALLERRGINVRLSGQGYVAGQSVPAGTPIARGATVNLTLKLK